MTVVVPEIVPLMVRLPLEVVIVQSPFCAEGSLNCEPITSISDVIALLEIVTGNDEMLLVIIFNIFDAALAKAVVTNSVVAICVVFVPATAVGAVGVPVSAGLALGASVAVPLFTAVATNSVVAICVVLVPDIAVGAVGTPVNAGEARGA